MATSLEGEPFAVDDLARRTLEGILSTCGWGRDIGIDYFVTKMIGKGRQIVKTIIPGQRQRRHAPSFGKAESKRGGLRKDVGVPPIELHSLYLGGQPEM